jgi:hypothetical protein
MLGRVHLHCCCGKWDSSESGIHLRLLHRYRKRADGGITEWLCIRQSRGPLKYCVQKQRRNGRVVWIQCRGDILGHSDLRNDDQALAAPEVQVSIQSKADHLLTLKYAFTSKPDEDESVRDWEAGTGVCLDLAVCS